jgi:hypothetical protein
MSGQETIESALQTNLRILSSDDMPLVLFSSSTIVGLQNNTQERWQLAVDTIYRCVVSGLLELTYPKYRADHNAFFQAIRTQNPFDRSGGVLWNWEQLYGTDKLVALVDKNFPDAGEAYDEAVDPAFIQELREIFAAAGVPWSDTPLLPVILTSAGAA